MLLVLLALVAGLWLTVGRGHTGNAAPPPQPHHRHRAPRTPRTNPRLDPDWEGDGKPVTMAFGGDVNFPSGSTLGDRLADDPATALGTGVPSLLSGVDLSMVNLETALTDGTLSGPAAEVLRLLRACQRDHRVCSRPGVSLVTEANNHGEDCGQAGLQMALTARAQSNYTVLGIGQNAAQAFTPYQATIDGEHIGIIAATQVIDDDLQTAWTATATQPGLASAYDVSDLVSAVEAARQVDDTVVVFLHWGVELDACPDPLQEPLANELVAGGSRHRHRQPRPRPPGRRLPRLGLRRLRPRQLRLLQHPAADRSERLAGDHGDRSPHRQRHLAAGGDRGRVAGAPVRGRRDHRPGELGERPHVHRPDPGCGRPGGQRGHRDLSRPGRRRTAALPGHLTHIAHPPSGIGRRPDGAACSIRVAGGRGPIER